MRMRARYAAWLLPVMLTACNPFHKPQPKPDQEFAPPIANLPKPPVDHAELTEGAYTLPLEPIETDVDVDESPLAPVHHHHLPHPAQAAVNPPPAPEDAEVSAIGQLSSGGPSDLHRQIDEAIASTERTLNFLGRPLSGAEQKTAAQIRAYLKEAREALITGDVDGAHTLVAKAKILLNELTQ